MRLYTKYRVVTVLNWSHTAITEEKLYKNLKIKLIAEMIKQLFLKKIQINKTGGKKSSFYYL